MCLYTRMVKNPKYKPNKKNGFNPPIPIDKRVMSVPIKCGRCIECMKAKRREWQIRLGEEIKHNKNAQFVTLTFSEEKLKELSEELNSTDANIIATKAVRRFLENWRSKHKKSVKHWLITELGHENTERIHLHGLIWTNDKEEIQNRWIYGRVGLGEYVNMRTVNYIIKYVTKVDKDHPEYVPKMMNSPAIGKGYEKTYNGEKRKFKGEETIEHYKLPNGAKTQMPIYYRNKIYTEEEREKLWLQKLDKEEIYIMGVKVNVRDSKKIEALLTDARKHNKKMGYGTIATKKKSYLASKNLEEK